MEMGILEYVPFAQEQLPWSWGEQSRLVYGGGSSALVWSQAGYVFPHSHKTGVIIST